MTRKEVLILMTVIFVLALAWSAFELLRRRKKTDGNKYGVNDKGKDKIYIRQSIVMIAAGVISFGVILFVNNFHIKDRAESAYSMQKDPYYRFYTPSGKENYDLDDWYDYYFETGDGSLYVALSIVYLAMGLLYPVYMYPAKVARKKEHEQTAAITVISSLFGGTIVIFIVMLIWANGGNKNAVPENYPNSAAPPLNKDSEYDKLEKLKELCDKGVITQDEFEQKKKDILKL